jgi:hypothetical protein
MNSNQAQRLGWGRQAAKMLLVALVVFCAPCMSFAAVIAVTVQFDLVKVTASFDAGTGFNIYTASPVGDGPYKTKDGAAPIAFFQRKPDGTMPSFINGFTGASIVNNFFQFRYFGSVAAAKGSILRNGTNREIVPSTEEPGYDVKAAAGKAISGFVIKLAQPTLYEIVSADGGNAFKNVDIAANKSMVTFSGGNIPVANFPAVGASADFLWSFITPVGPQPKFPAGVFTDPVIPPDPAGEFKDVLYVGKATTPEPSTLVMMVVGLAGIGLLMRRRQMAGAVESQIPLASRVSS